MKMKTQTRYLVAGVVAIVLSGCASTAVRPKDALVGEIRLGDANSGVMAPVQAELEDALMAWGTSDLADVSDAAERLEKLLEDYASEDGAFERAVLTTLALYYLEMGNRADFERSVDNLRMYIDDNVYLPRETQYVLMIGQGNENNTLPGRGVNPRFTNAIKNLLGE